MAFTTVQIQAHLDAWLAADLAVANGQSYMIGGRSLTRANAKEITNKINYWNNLLVNSTNTGIRQSRVVPRDI